MSKIFISYRREDSETQARLVFETLKVRYGEANIFWDLHQLKPGINFVDQIYNALDQSAVVLVIIGPQWISIKNEKGARRLELPNDLVRIEVAKSLQKKKAVIPIVVGGAKFPQSSELPRTLKDLAKQHGINLRAGPDFEHDMSTILQAISEAVAASPELSTLAPSDVLPETLANLGFTWAYPNDQNVIIPPVCDVPAGPFLMGSQEEPNETPLHNVSLRSFSISKFPVTVAEYRCFAIATGNPPRDNELLWQDQVGRLDHPVVNVSWLNAVAYSNWLSTQTGQKWRLPAEAEWEKAARWDPSAGHEIQRAYPWGPQFESVRCNTRESGLNSTTPVGSFPRGISAVGVQDMAGNVWEWTSSVFGPFPYASSDGRERVDMYDLRVRRGGSWDSHSSRARCAKRAYSYPDHWNPFIGFRLVLGA